MNVRQSASDFRLVKLNADGLPEVPILDLPAAIVENCNATADFYRKIGFVSPWVGYIALYEELAVGGGAFVGPPINGRVEIAYYTLPELEGRGFATLTAKGLVQLARDAVPEIEVFAKTLPQLNASTSILRQLGFQHIGTAMDEDIGEAWAWLLPALKRRN